jgi:hypothetical protein
LGRYLHIDPLNLLLYGIENDNRKNLFKYANLNPINFADPEGLIVSSPLSCVDAINGAEIECEEEAEGFRNDIRYFIEDCQKRGECCVGLSMDINCECKNCGDFEGCGSLSHIRVRCAQKSEEWLNAAKKNISWKCAAKVGIAIVKCLK